MAVQNKTKTTPKVKARPARPFVKWVGGKGRLVPELSKYFPKQYNDYYEPFVGGGAVFFALNPPTAHINDLNLVLITLYTFIRDDVNRVIGSLEKLEKQYHALASLEDKKELYLSKRGEFNELDNGSFEKAVLLVFLNKTCFNGMYRENSKGGFNVPFGKHEKPTICDRENLLLVHDKLEHTTITHSSYEVLTAQAKKGDFIYFDPPYHPLNTTSSFTSYQAGGFSADDQTKLRDEFKRLSDLGCKVMLSNSDAPLINELYKDFNINKIYAARAINSKGDGRGKILEVLVTNY